MNRHVQIVHIIADVMLFGIVTYVFNSKIRRQEEYVQHLESKIHYLHEKISQIETSLSKLYVHYVATPALVPTPTPTPAPTPTPTVETILVSSVSSVPVFPVNEVEDEDEIQRPSPPSPTISSELNKHQDTLVIDYTKDPIDREIFEELQEVESYQSESSN